MSRDLETLSENPIPVTAAGESLPAARVALAYAGDLVAAGALLAAGDVVVFGVAAAAGDALVAGDASLAGAAGDGDEADDAGDVEVTAVDGRAAPST